MEGNITIREARIDDAARLLEVIPRIDAETDFLIRAPGEFKLTLEEEQKFIQSMVDDKKCLFLVALYGDTIVGTLGFKGNSLTRYQHTGEFGMGVLKEYWGFGIGSKLLEGLLDWAMASGIHKINLKVVASNTRAMSLYEKFGFELEGRLKDSVKIENEYCDLIIMGKITG